jgi:hypothetical protein
VLTLSVSEVLRTTPRTRRIRLALHGQPFPYLAGQAVLVGLRAAATVLDCVDARRVVS